MTNSSGILSHCAGMCLFSLQAEVGSVAVSGRRSPWRAECFCCVTGGVCQTFLWVAGGVILLVVDRLFPLRSGRQMVLLACCLTTLSIILLPGSEDTLLGLGGVAKRRGEESSDKKKKNSFGKIYWLGENYFQLLACPPPPPPYTSPRTYEASGGGALCCVYARCYINSNKL